MFYVCYAYATKPWSVTQYSDYTYNCSVDNNELSSPITNIAITYRNLFKILTATYLCIVIPYPWYRYKS